MRRLAKQTRDDSYSSLKDYQTVTTEKTVKIVVDNELNKICFPIDLTGIAEDSLVGFGGFLKCTIATPIKISLISNENIVSKSFNLKANWSRVGFALKHLESSSENYKLVIEWKGPVDINYWGLYVDLVELPEAIKMLNPDLQTLNASHLSPETYYLNHGEVSYEIDVESSTDFQLIGGDLIHLKKCSYCQRKLPINPNLLGSLSFHKHNAKLTKHQNECRSCKKWRINDNFNPLRTTDQLHESSVITRERKVLLKEPEILQEIKDRNGAGLKSIIWKKFGKKCFYCKTPVNLNEFQLDHTRPLAYLWPIDEHATCLCATHNNQKKEKFPVEFYSKEQLLELSEITGLSYEELVKKDVNQEQLDRIVNDIEDFALQWDSRTFAAIARKIIELRPEVDLFKILEEKNIDLYDELKKDLDNRPNSVI
ncbi:hypothetical protein VBY74_03110 [Tenacibaculum ascidiaceicola]|uniref:HNH endonuclease n=1 Tax=Tenacibaculum ascidiaceicola TaxID=1699411 RepID=UPI0039E86EB9